MITPDKDYPWWWGDVNIDFPTFGEYGMDSRKMKLRDSRYWPNIEYFCAAEQLWAIKSGFTDDPEGDK